MDYQRNFIREGLWRAPLFFFLCLHSVIAYGQTNLVPNPSFEQYTNCPPFPIYNFHLNDVDDWYKPDAGGGGYFNACANNVYKYTGVPFENSGYQYARTGNAYIGLLYAILVSQGSNYYQVKLKSALIKGKKYYGSHYLNLSNDSKYGCNNHGILFSNDPVRVDDQSPNQDSSENLYATPQIENKEILRDTLNWVRVAGVFRAAGGESYLTLGNFRGGKKTASVLTPTTVLPYFPCAYLIDDVSLYNLDSFKLDADAGRDTVIFRGDSVFIGSYTSGIDTLAWRQNGNTLIDTAHAGLWESPTANTFYVLTQTVGGYTSSDTVYVKVLQPLPVSVVSRELLVVGEGVVQFSWQTANEADVWRYVVERSTDGQHFESLGVVDAAGLGAYRFMDYGAVVGMGYYRVKVVGHDGKVGYSKVYSIRIDKAVNRLSLLPNPADNLITVKAASLKEVRILNTEGRVVCSEKTIHNTSTIDISRLPKGIYLVKGVQENNAEVSEKLIKE